MDVLSENDFVVIDEFLPETLYQEIRSFFNLKLNDFDKAGIGAQDKYQIASNIRGDYVYWLDRDRDVALEEYWQLVEETVATLNRYCFLSLSGYEFHLAHYPPGGHYDRHLDQFKDRSNRMISVVIYLNEGWQRGDGGELEIFQDDDTTLVEPLGKRCVMFKSANVPHAVRNSYKSRYSLTGWLLYHPSRLGSVLG